MSLELQTTQEQVTDFFSLILTKVENWELAPTNAYIFLKKLEKAFEDAKEKIYEMAKKEMDQYWPLELESLPYWASAKRVDRKTYEYKQNPKYLAMSEALKTYEKLLKIATDNQTAITDPDTWEQVYGVDFKTNTIYMMKV